MKVLVRRVSQGLIACCLLAVTTAVLAPHHVAPAQEVQQEVSQVVQQAIIPQPQEAEAHVAIPTNLKIPAIKVDAQVLAMGIGSDGRMEVPNDFVHVGWYKFGATPGQIGSAVMGAHVDNGGAISGVFKKLKYLQVGDDIYTTDSDGNTQHFKVVVRKIYDYKTQITDEVFAEQDAARLNLITCYGTWLPKEKTYNERLVVFAKLVQ